MEYAYGWSREPGERDCALSWTVTTVPSSATCGDCDLVIEAQLDLDPSSYGGRECDFGSSGSVLFGLQSDPPRGYSGVYVEYYREFYPVWYGEFDGDYAEFWMGYEDYLYEYYGRDYYYTWALSGGFTLPE